MSENLEELYETLKSKKEYYQQKALMLERKLIYAEERVREVAEKEQKMKQWEMRETQLKQALEEAKKQREKKQVNKEKQNEYEDLLQRMEEELNQKEGKIEFYRMKIQSLQEQLQQKTLMQTKSLQVQEAQFDVYSYFDYTVILHDAPIIQANFYIENKGDKVIEQPMVCFRMKPGHIFSLHGKQIVYDPAIVENKEDKWLFVPSEQMEKGEIWLMPLAPVQLQKNSQIALTEIQIPIPKEADGFIEVEAFVYDDKKVNAKKAKNEIRLSIP